MKFAKAVEIIRWGLFERRHFRLAQIDSDRDRRASRTVAQLLQTRRDDVRAVVVETEAIDEGQLLRIPKNARPRIARLRLSRNRADLDEAKTERLPGRNGHAILIEAGREADRIREG